MIIKKLINSVSINDGRNLLLEVKYTDIIVNARFDGVLERMV